MALTKALTWGTESRPCSPTMRTMAEPTMTPSAKRAIDAACSGVDMPNPMAHGMSVTRRTAATMDSRFELNDVRMPVTPMEDTTYRNPSASEAILAILSSEVGAIMETRFTPWAVHAGCRSPFSSYGASGTIRARTPTSAHLATNLSIP